jgi:2-polyprenyl-3-methyl-5-hydroxy-6-metoxy-1,4-benzoquinol methylase
MIPSDDEVRAITMQRITEPEIMDDEEQVIAYGGGDFSTSNQYCVDRLVELHGPGIERVLDIGCGPGDVPVRLAKAVPSAHVTAVDASEPMVRLARQRVREAGLEGRITVVQDRLPGLGFDEPHDVIMSKDFLHHLPDPAVFWDEVKRLSRGDTVLFLMDLYRPATEADVCRIVESVCGNDPPVLQRDLHASLLAAFTPDEVRKQIVEAGLDLGVEVVSERHYIVHGRI